VKTTLLKIVLWSSNYFTALLMTKSLVWTGLAFHHHQVELLAVAVLNLYLTPLLAYRVFHLFLPVCEGWRVIWPPQDAALPTWYVGHKLQLIYVAMPFLERVLVPVPGLYAFWIRCWGGKVGRRVNFTPQIEILDRGLVDIGDECFFGHQVFMSSHLVVRSRGKYMLYVRRIRLGESCFVGAMCRFGPGTDIEAGTFIPVASYTIKDDKKPRVQVRM
jgi:hypothetical protein